MYREDRIYNLINDYRLPINRKDASTQQFFDSYFKDYVKDCKEASNYTDICTLRKQCYKLLKKNINVLEDLCEDILEFYRLYDNSDIIDSYTHFSDLMEKISSFLIVEDLKNTCNSHLYRIRTGKKDFLREELFHIPKDKRHLIGSYRYSLPGQPCLYLSTGIQTSWFECSMPKEFSYAKFKLKKNCKVINFTDKPVDLIMNSCVAYKNNSKDNSLERLDRLIVNYLVTFPLKAACSLEVVNRKVPFIEEYTMPQQLLLWVMKHNDIDGIAYRTSTSIPEAQRWNQFNLALPAKKINNKHCEHLMSIFDLTRPQKVTLNHVCQEYEKNIDKIENYIVKIEEICKKMYPFKIYVDIISICRSFQQQIGMLLNIEYNNTREVYQTIETLSFISTRIFDNHNESSSLLIEELKKELEKHQIEDKIDLRDLVEELNVFKNEILPLIKRGNDYILFLKKKSFASCEDFRSISGKD